ncbi:MAG: hypothetical protein BGO11_02005 [Solirubrobacterales bacterium 70-9]|nr:MAG: hypothetical protein BGO11_02005 [Solirubrobacterales bacterium 70-9]
MSVRVSVRRVRRRAALVAALAASACLAVAGAASAATPFGGNPNGTVTPGLNCENSAGPYFQGAPTCTWWWSHAGVGSDIAPLPVTGGSDTITSVTLPAMSNPGTMQVVILTAALSATNEPSRPQFICCQVKALGPTFTVPANQVTTVPQSLAVSASKEANLEHPGETSFGDIAAISVLTPGASLPLRYTGQTPITSPNSFDVDEAYFPAPTAPNGEFTPSVDPSGFELMAQFTLGGAPAAGAAPTPAPTPTPGPAAKGGVKLGGDVFRPGADGKTLGLGKATNPPTAGTTQTLTLPTGAARASATGGKAKKPVVLGKGKTTVPSGKSAPLKLTLNSKALAKLSKGHQLKATLTIVATNPQGESQTVTRAVTVKPAKPKKKN